MSMILRLIFWFAIVIYFLPLDFGGTPASKDTPRPAEAVASTAPAIEDIEDIVNLCARNAALCEAGKAALMEAGAQALENARDTITGSVTPPVPRPDAPAVPVPQPRPAN